MKKRPLGPFVVIDGMTVAGHDEEASCGEASWG